ncbi:MAG TPA: hypothetical protein VEL74_23185 [Thermoanaerobaculia bacterium]|nr:hypothetical protein [Thermoanaerobaculia bacterium]
MKRFFWVGLFALVLTAALPVGASTFVALTPDQLVEQSDAIVQGEVLKINSFWTSDGSVIVSEALVQVTDTIAGDSPTVLRVKTFGGTVGGYTVEAHGFPGFRAGDRVLLFVQNQADGTVEVTGYRQGQYRVAFERGMEKAIPTLESGVNLLTPDGRQAIRPVAKELESFKQQIRERAERARAFVNN